MNHLTNLYKHKCEQLQEQLNHLTRQLNEVTAPAPAAPAAPWPPVGWVDNFGDDAARAAERLAARLAREAARLAREAAERALRETRERLFQQFRTLNPNGDYWDDAYHLLSDADRAIYHQMFGHPPHPPTVGFWAPIGTIQVRIMVGPGGIPGIYYWDSYPPGGWTRLPDGVKIQGLGSNYIGGISYQKKILKKIEKDELTPPGQGGAPGEFYPRFRQDPYGYRNTPNQDIQPGPGGLGSGGLGQGGGGGGAGGGGGGGGDIDPNNQSGLGVQY